ncbi:hypothetical protein EAG_10516 [Camponotus floridanus]|uniref:Uncharacterized protein n=1 Tax=Camponotus floridanus TaxID=104421 RepID=E2AF23_CAMFO|nr:hypothetical protein EAG_10516 [Camponotus floridanus]
MLALAMRREHTTGRSNYEPANPLAGFEHLQHNSGGNSFAVVPTTEGRVRDAARPEAEGELQEFVDIAQVQQLLQQQQQHQQHHHHQHHQHQTSATAASCIWGAVYPPPPPALGYHHHHHHHHHHAPPPPPSDTISRACAPKRKQRNDEGKEYKTQGNDDNAAKNLVSSVN